LVREFFSKYLDAAGIGPQEAMNETFGQLDELLASLTST
jgi:hypothetical protein